MVRFDKLIIRSRAVSEGLDSPTDEMISKYESRTRKHIEAVRRNLIKFEGFSPELTKESLEERGGNHDKDKLSGELRLPYIFVNWKHRCRRLNLPFNPSKETLLAMDGATAKHIKNNRHHPEFHSKDNLSNFTRDSASSHEMPVVKVGKMELLDLAEMVADWQSMAQEKNENGGSPRAWADANVGKRWEFTPDDTETIYKLIDWVEDKK